MKHARWDEPEHRGKQYGITFHCLNCGHVGRAWFTLGERWHFIPCPVCKCNDAFGRLVGRA